jgi:hypothetical protein
MNDRKPGPDGAVDGDEPFVQRWSRLKAQARDETKAAPSATAATPPEPPAPPAEAEAPIELPDLDSLDGDADYSAFLAPGVDSSLRQRALRKLFHSPKFNELDGLDDYMGDFTKFEALGNIVTADMRHRIERAAQRAAEQLLRDEGDRPSGPAVSAAAPDEPAQAPVKDSDDGHDRPA